MKYKCVDDLDKFDFQEAPLTACGFEGDTLKMTFDGAIAKYNNPCNTKYEDSFIGTTQVRFKNARIRKLFLEGAKYYDANNVLLEEIPDKDILPEEYGEVLEKMSNGKVFILRGTDAGKGDGMCFVTAVDVEEETYWLEAEYEKVILEWERFMGKVTQ